MERGLDVQLPASVREWYRLQGAIRILAEHSNDDPPIVTRDFQLWNWESHTLLPIRYENQGVCTWAIMLDGSDDPPVYVDVDTAGKEWRLLAPTFSGYVYSCVWDYKNVLNRPALVQAQNRGLTESALDRLVKMFTPEITTHGWPGSNQHRFQRPRQGILIWAAEGQADWFVGAPDSESLQSALEAVWHIDAVGESLYDCSDIGRSVLERLRQRPNKTLNPTANRPES